MVYGYARVSTPKQRIDRQIRNIKSADPEAVIVQDAYTGTKMERPNWSRLVRAVKPGDTVIFDEVSRMARNAEEGFAVYQALYQRGVELRFLKEPHISTAVFREAAEKAIPMTGTEVDLILEGVNRYLLALAEKQIRIAFTQAQQEVEYLHQRTREGIETARLNGKQIGQPTGVKLVTKKSQTAKYMIRKYSRDFEGSLSDTDCIRLIGCARGSYYKYKRELKND